MTAQAKWHDAKCTINEPGGCCNVECEMDGEYAARVQWDVTKRTFARRHHPDCTFEKDARCVTGCESNQDYSKRVRDSARPDTVSARQPQPARKLPGEALLARTTTRQLVCFLVGAELGKLLYAIFPWPW